MFQTSRATLAEAFSGRANSFGLLRLVFASMVLFAHSWILGIGIPLDVGLDLSGIAVAGFFGISGFLITRSARKTPIIRYLWHRTLRILPGLAVCLMVTAFVFAPILWVTGGISDPNGYPFKESAKYVISNLPTANGAFGINVLLVNNTPYGHITGISVFNGSLWTLQYEITGYLLVGLAALIGILRRARVVMLLLVAAAFGVLCWNAVAHWRGWPELFMDGAASVPYLGYFMFAWALWYGFMFFVGSLFELYSDKIRIDDRLGWAAVAVTAIFAVTENFFGPALLTFAYVLLWLAIRLPAPLQRIGQKRDYSYGIYIYAFPVQQSLASFGLGTWWLPAYIVASATVTVIFAALSWHFVESVAMRAKDFQLSSLRKYSFASRFGA